jgi:hypothetical protein
MVTCEDRLLEILTKNSELESPLVDDHPDMVQMLLRVVQDSLSVAEVAAERGVRRGLMGKAIGVDPPVVLVTSPK